MKFYNQGIKKARIEIIPMIDTIFFLLVYFMFQTLQMVKMSAMEVSIPKPAPPSSTAPPPRCNVVVDALGNYQVDNRPVTKDGIPDAVRADIARNAQTLVVISVSSTQSVQPLIDCLDGVNQVNKPDGSPVNTLINGQGGINLAH